MVDKCIKCEKAVIRDDRGNIPGADFVGTPAYGSRHDFGGDRGLTMELVVCDDCLATHSHLFTVVMKTKTQTTRRMFHPDHDFEYIFVKQREEDR